MQLITSGIPYWELVTQYNQGNSLHKNYLARAKFQSLASEAPLECLRRRSQAIVEVEFFKSVATKS